MMWKFKPILGLSWAALLAAGCHCPSAGPAPTRPRTGVPTCDRLLPRKSLITFPYPGFSRDVALLTETLFGRARELRSHDVFRTETPVLAMIKADPHVAEEAVYVLSRPAKPTQPRGYRVVHARAKEPLTGALRSPGAHIWETFMEERTFRALERAWGTMARGARWPHGEEARRLPKLWAVTEYTFEYAGTDGYGQGDVYGPEVGTCTASLAGLGELLIRLADEPDKKKRTSLEAEIQRQSQALRERLEGWE